jgi:hypothetical protein
MPFDNAPNAKDGWLQLKLPLNDLSQSLSPGCHQIPLSPADALSSVMAERRERTKLGLSRYAAEAAERAGASDGDLSPSRNVRDVASVHSTIWPQENQQDILQVNVLTGVKIDVVRDADKN